MCELHIHNGVSLSEPLLNAVHLLGHPYVCMYVFSEVMSQPCPPPPAWSRNLNSIYVQWQL